MRVNNVNFLGAEKSFPPELKYSFMDCASLGGGIIRHSTNVACGREFIGSNLLLEE